MALSKINKFVCASSIFCLALALGCTTSKIEAPDTQTQETVADAAPVRGPENLAQRISFTYHHPKAVQNNVFYHWRSFGDVYVDDLGQETPAELLEALRVAATEDFVPNDYPLGCRQAERQPQFRLRLEIDGKPFEFMSSSQCLGLAPFNATAGQAMSVQYNGKLGQALLNLLNAREPARWKKLDLKPGLIEFGKRDLMDWVFQSTTEDADGLLKQFQAMILNSDKRLGEFLESANVMPLPLPEIACNQANNAQCEKLLGRYKLKLGDGVYFHQAIAVDGTVLSFQSPSSLQEIMAALKTPALSAYLNAIRMYSKPLLAVETPDKIELADEIGEAGQSEHLTEPNVVAITWKPQGDCAMLKALAPHFKVKELEDCSAYSLFVEGKEGYMYGVYYPGLEALWLSQSQQIDAFFNALVLDPRTPRDTKKQLSTPKRLPYLAPNVQVFFDTRGQLFAFKTSDGKTTRMP